ncbi:hypothetical protein [Nannocystis pusilla]|uniref:hypothetical protein n=1 Tax=Nannocystis pusilla TaxID=889268 RepID=UPI003B808F43
MARTAPKILVTERQRRILDKLERSHKTPQQLVPRVQIVKLSGQGVPNNEQAVELDMGPEAIGRWRHRWLDGQAELAAAEESGVSELELERLILKVLADGPRPGAPPRFGAHQVAQIFALACEPRRRAASPSVTGRLERSRESWETRDRRLDLGAPGRPIFKGG